jgi:D-alanine-D-alanine ligase
MEISAIMAYNAFMKKKPNVIILFGGKSAEHEVSIRSAKNIATAIDPKKYSRSFIKITPDGRWWFSDSMVAFENKIEVAFVPQGRGKIVAVSSSKKIPQADVVFIALHGPNGEDGSVQGLLTIADVPFVGAGVLGSAVGMDKDVMKRLLRDAGIPIAKFVVFTKGQRSGSDFYLTKKTLGVPMFVKPANLGSSVGISKVKTKAEFAKALRHAFLFDTKVIVEEFIDGREIECSVLQDRNPNQNSNKNSNQNSKNGMAKASIPGEVITASEFYSYDAKYKSSSDASFAIPPTGLSKAMIKRIQDLAAKTFQVLCCEGLGRVDFFLKKDGELLVNEINTIPGFTEISLYPRMWAMSGLPTHRLVQELISLAQERHKIHSALKMSL